MYCRYCGNELRENARFCTRCGKNADIASPAVAEQSQPVSSTSHGPASASGASNPSYTPEHPYKRLGGFLAFIDVVAYIGGGLLILLAISLGVTLSNLSTVLNGVSYGNSIVQQIVPIVFFLMIVCIAAGAFAIYYATLILKRNPSFLKVFHIYCIVAIVIGIIIVIAASATLAPYTPYLARSAGGVDPTASMMMSIFSTVVGAVLITLYYVKSVRVRTYFGSDEYLRQSPFTRNMQAPEPAVAD